MAKKLEVWTLSDFSTFLSQNIKKIEGRPFVEKNSISEKVPQCLKETGKGTL